MSDPVTSGAKQKSEQEEMEEAKKKAEEVLKSTRPRDAIAGLGSGLAAMGAGILGGAVGLVAAPIKGAKEGGVGGLVAGVAAGVVGAVVLPVGGVVAGTVQIGRGIVNTPEAIAASAQGKVWNKDTKEWEAPNELPSTAVQVYDENAAKARGGAPAAKQSGEDLYLYLEVGRDASPEQIKKQYYKLARKYHPDKNGSDPEAKEKFQAVGRAFQILGNPETRSRYDRGLLDASGQETMDAGIFFTMLFGSDKFEPFIGELLMATAARSGDERPSKADLMAGQKARVARIAGNLAAMLDAYDDADPGAFRAAKQAQAQALAAESFGEQMLHVIGEIYFVEAEIYQGNFVEAGLLRLKDKRETFKAELEQAKLAVSAMRNAEKVQAATEELARKVAENPEDPELLYNSLNAKEQMKHETMALTLQLMWASNAVDIRQTLKSAIKLMLKGDKDAADRRAKALRALGEVFQAAAAPDALRTRSKQFKETLAKMEEVMGGAPHPEDA